MILLVLVFGDVGVRAGVHSSVLVLTGVVAVVEVRIDDHFFDKHIF